MLIEGTTLKLPSATEDLPDQVFDLAEILTAEARQNEIAIITPVKAPELLHLFNYAWLETSKVAKKLAAQIVKAKQATEKRRATILLYEVDDFLKSKGLDSTKDTRDAFIVLDPKYQALQDRVDQLTAAREWLVDKVKSFEHSYSSVKKIMGEDAYNMSYNKNPNLSGSGNSRPFVQPKQTPTTTPPTTNPPKSGYGKARYDRQ
jgi:hypothetical protein